MFELLLSIKADPGRLPSVLGPGPQELIAGDVRAGYFGTLPSDSLITQTALNTAHNIVRGTAYGDSDWMKFILDGKIFFISLRTNRVNISKSGIVEGIGKTGKTIKIGELTYLHRCIRGDTKDPSNLTTGTFFPSDKTEAGKGVNGSEWGRLMVNICSDPALGLPGTWAKFTKADLGMVAADASGANTVCYEDSLIVDSVLSAGGGNGVLQRTLTGAASANWIGHRNVLVLQ